MAKTYYWLKLKQDFFGSKPMKRLRKIAGGDTYTIIYLKMQLKSLKDDGNLYYEGIDDSFADEIALDIEEETDDVKAAIVLFKRFGLIEEISPTQVFMSEVPELTGKECESAARVRKHRDKVASEIGKTLQCNTKVTKCNTEKEIEKEIEIDKEHRERINYPQIADMYNEICISFPRCKSLSENRKKAIRARLNNYSLADLQTVFEKAEASDFLKGNNYRNWSATLDWMLKDSNMAKILDGNYDNKGATEKQTGTQKFDPLQDMLNSAGGAR